MLLKPGDIVPTDCEQVDHLPPEQLALAGDGTLAEVPGSGVTAKGKLFLRSRKQDYIDAFAAHGLTICEDFHPFDEAKAPLRLALSGAIATLFIWGSDATTDKTFIALSVKFDGTPNLKFGGTGRVVLPATTIGATAGTFSLACVGQPDGKLLACGNAIVAGPVHVSVIVRFLANGELDPSWGAGGVLVQPEPPVGSLSTSLTPSGINVVPGSGGQISHNYLVSPPSLGFDVLHFRRLGPTGAVLGDVVADDDLTVGPGYPYYSPIALPDGRFVGAAPNAPSLSPPDWIVLWDADGFFDTQIDVPDAIGNPTNLPIAIGGQRDGKFLFASVNAGGEATVRRYNADLSVDFDAVIGSGLTDVGDYAEVVGAGSDGKIMVGVLNQITGALFLGRLNGDGSIDTTFGTAGIVTGTVDLTNVNLNIAFGCSVGLGLT